MIQPVEVPAMQIYRLRNHKGSRSVHESARHHVNATQTICCLYTAPVIRRSDFAVHSRALSVWADTAVDADATDTAEPRRSVTPVSGLWAVCERAERCERAEESPAGGVPISLLLPRSSAMWIVA